MPQLDYTSFSSQLFWLAITFSLLYIALSKAVLPVIRNVLQARQDRISYDLEKAEAARREAEEAKQDYTAALEKARRNAASALAEVTANLKKEAARQHAELDLQLSKQAQNAEQRIATLKTETQAQILPVSIMLAERIIKKLLGAEINPDTIASIVRSHNQRHTS